MTTLLWDAAPALRTLLSVAVGVPVYDAGELVGENATAYIVVGDRDDGDLVADSTQEISRMGGNDWRTETGSISVVVEAWDGGTDVSVPRAAARALLDTATGAVRNDRTLGGLLTPPGRADITAVRLRERQTDRGAVVQASFTVTYTALLTS